MSPPASRPSDDASTRVEDLPNLSPKVATNIAEPQRSADDPRERVIFHRSGLVIHDGHPMHPIQVPGQEIVVTVTREGISNMERPWWMRLIGVFPAHSVVVDIRVPGADWHLMRGSLAHGGETSFRIRSVDE